MSEDSMRRVYSFAEALKIVVSRIRGRELCCQLAEECLEVGDALWRRKQEGRDKLGSCFAERRERTEERAAMLEETADVQLVIRCMLEGVYTEDERAIYKSLLAAASTAVQGMPAADLEQKLGECTFRAGQAALKLRRATGKDNPTPVSAEEARNRLLCDMSVLTAVVRQLFTDAELEGIALTEMRKADRWARRLIAAGIAEKEEAEKTWQETKDITG